jgi:hypothetical protein
MSRLRLWGIGFVLLLVGLTGCYPLPGELPPTETPTLTPSLTPTPVWFPATATPTSLPTPLRSPTPELRPLVGEPILEDAFSPETAWRSFTGSIGNIAFADDHLTLAINQPNGMIYAFRETPEFDGFYAEITARANLCRGDDEYGLMLRVSGVRIDHYRFALTCSGKVKFVRVYGSRSVVLQPLEQIPAAPVGFPSESVLGVWALGGELRLFLNGSYLFTINDPVISKGAIGVYVRTISENPISVNFSRLEVYEIEE